MFLYHHSPDTAISNSSANKIHSKVKGIWDTYRYCPAPWLVNKRHFWTVVSLQWLKQHFNLDVNLGVRTLYSTLSKNQAPPLPLFIKNLKYLTFCYFSEKGSHFVNMFQVNKKDTRTRLVELVLVSLLQTSLLWKKFIPICNAAHIFSCLQETPMLAFVVVLAKLV